MTVTNLFRLLVSLLVCTFLIGACGQKGPLFLSGNPSEIQVEVPAQDEEDEEEEDDDADDETPR